MDSDRILNGFCSLSQCIQIAFSMDFGRILNGFWKDSHAVLKWFSMDWFWDALGRIPYRFWKGFCMDSQLPLWGMIPHWFRNVFDRVLHWFWTGCGWILHCFCKAFDKNPIDSERILGWISRCFFKANYMKTQGECSINPSSSLIESSRIPIGSRTWWDLNEYPKRIKWQFNHDSVGIHFNLDSMKTTWKHRENAVLDESKWF